MQHPLGRGPKTVGSYGCREIAGVLIHGGSAGFETQGYPNDYHRQSEPKTEQSSDVCLQDFSCVEVTAFLHLARHRSGAAASRGKKRRRTHRTGSCSPFSVPAAVCVVLARSQSLGWRKTSRRLWARSYCWSLRVASHLRERERAWDKMSLEGVVVHIPYLE